MSLYDLEDDPGWFTRFLSWTTDIWSRWTAPSPDKLPYDRSLIKARLELCLTRMRLVKQKQEALNKQVLAELDPLASSESMLAEPGVRSFLDLSKLHKVFDLLEPHITLLLGSLDLPSHDMSPMNSVHAVLYAAPRVPRIEELASVRQQLLQKYGPVLAITKTDLIERDLLETLEKPTTRLDILKWLDAKAPNKRWATDLAEEESRQLAIKNAESSRSTHNTIQYPMPSDLLDQSYSKKLLDSQNHLAQSAPPHDDDNDSDDDDDDGNGGSASLRDLMGNSHDSGPTDSPIPPLETSAFDFPDVPASPPLVLYPSLSLSNSLEQQIQQNLQSSLAH